MTVIIEFNVHLQRSIQYTISQFMTWPRFTFFIRRWVFDWLTVSEQWVSEHCTQWVSDCEWVTVSEWVSVRWPQSLICSFWVSEWLTDCEWVAVSEWLTGVSELSQQNLTHSLTHSQPALTHSLPLTHSQRFDWHLGTLVLDYYFLIFYYLSAVTLCSPIGIMHYL